MRIGNSQKHDFELSFDSDNIVARNSANTLLLTVNAELKPTGRISVEHEQSELTLFDLYGVLTCGNVSARMWPMNLYHLNAIGTYSVVLPLVFEMTRSQIQYFEQERAKNGPTADMMFTLELYGIVLVRSTATNNPGELTFLGIYTAYPNASFRIARSDWHDRILPGLGYDESILIELPLPKFTSTLEQVAEAVRYLEMARQRLRGEKYRDAVHFCREAKDALTKRDPNEMMSLLESLIGETKAATVDKVLRAFGDLYNASSHPRSQSSDERIEFTREDAMFAVNSLTFILDYVAHAVHSQSVDTP